MITLKQSTSEAIRIEMESIPEKYQKPFNSVHEGLAVLREEYVELENEIFFGEKRARAMFVDPDFGASKSVNGDTLWKDRIRHEAIQVAAMAARIIQELT
jgi:hypothetical protein